MKLAVGARAYVSLNANPSTGVNRFPGTGKAMEEDPAILKNALGLSM